MTQPFGFVPPVAIPAIGGAANVIIPTAGILGGAAAGARAGAILGPKGAIAGAVAGGLLLPLLFPPSTAPGTVPGLDPGLNPRESPDAEPIPSNPDSWWEPPGSNPQPGTRYLYTWYEAPKKNQSVVRDCDNGRVLEPAGTFPYYSTTRFFHEEYAYGIAFRFDPAAEVTACGSENSGWLFKQTAFVRLTQEDGTWETKPLPWSNLRDGASTREGFSRSATNYQTIEDLTVDEVPVPEPMPQPKPEPQPRPLPVPIRPLPTTDPVPAPVPLPDSEPQPLPLEVPSPGTPNAPPITIPKAPPAKPRPVPTKPAPVPLPLPSPVIPGTQPKPAPDPFPGTDPKPQPQPVPAPGPQPGPQPLPGVVPLPLPIPDAPPITEPSPDPQTDPAPGPQPGPQPGPVPIPQPPPVPSPDPSNPDPQPFPGTDPLPGESPLPSPLPLPGPIPAPIPLPGITPAPRPIDPISGPVPLPGQYPKPTPPGHHFPVTGGPAVTPGGTRPDIAAIAAEVGRIEQKTANIQRPGGLPDVGQLAELAQLLLQLLEEDLPGTTYKLTGVCEDPVGEGQQPNFTISIPPAKNFTAITERLDVIDSLLQQHLAWKTPICSDKERPTLEGDFRTIHFVSDEKTDDGGTRLRKRFRYRSTSGQSLGSIVDHWRDFAWQAGPVCVQHAGTSWGTPQIWAATADEGKRVIRHAAGEAGIDPDQNGRWIVGGSNSSRLGLPGTMRVSTRGGVYRITARDGTDGPPMVAIKPYDP